MNSDLNLQARRSSAESVDLLCKAKFCRAPSSAWTIPNLVIPKSLRVASDGLDGLWQRLPHIVVSHCGGPIRLGPLLGPHDDLLINPPSSDQGIL